jgi:regulator of sigma E protease
VLIHEFGHFIAARIFGMRVEKFYLFFNPWFSVLKVKRKDTEYGVGWVPFGGYVKIAGMVDESMDREQMRQPPKPDEFRSKPAWQRLLVIGGGVLMNLVLAVAIYIGISAVWGEKYIANRDVAYGYAFSPLGVEIGFRNGDRILAVNGKQVERVKDVFFEIVLNDRAEVSVLRGEDTLTVAIGPEHKAAFLSAQEPLLVPRVPFVVEKVMPSGGADNGGMLAGDVPVAVIVAGDSASVREAIPMQFYDEFTAAFARHRGRTVELAVQRDSAGVALTRTLTVPVDTMAMIGVQIASLEKLLSITHVEYSFFAAFPAGVRRTGVEIANYWRQFKLIFNPSTKAYKSLGGPIAIASIFPSYWSFEEFWRLTAFLSIVLAVMNILPIPALDGGQMLFIFVEIVTRRKPSDRSMEIAQWIGMIILFGLIAFALKNDIFRFFIN